jgi:hypothetical protein
MKRFLTISVLILIYFLNCSKSCSNMEDREQEQRDQRVAAVKDSIRSALQADSLTGASLKAYQTAGRQKFSDFCDYLAIIADTGLAGPFRDQAAEMTGTLFCSPKVELVFSATTDDPGKKITVDQLKQPGTKIRDLLRGFRTDSLRNGKPLARINDSTYAGSLSFLTAGPAGVKNNRASASTGSIEILVLRKSKTIGKETLRVWDVFLGKMEIR